jgi:hypothetical protein
MSLPIIDPANMTDGLKNFVALIHREVVKGDLDTAERMLVDLYNDIGLAYVCDENPDHDDRVVPDYDPAEDGDYSFWLALNNID